MNFDQLTVQFVPIQVAEQTADLFQWHLPMFSHFQLRLRYVEHLTPTHDLMQFCRQVAWDDDQTALQVAAQHEFLDEQAGHDRFSSAGIVS